MSENEEDQETGQQQESGANAEAKKYRRRLREVEAERDQLQEQVQTLRRSEVERQVSGELEDPSDLWRAGTELEHLLDEDGAVDQGKVAETARAVTAEHPGWRKVSGVDEDQGRASESFREPSWTALLRPQ